jgi:hypothetical protein
VFCVLEALAMLCWLHQYLAKRLGKSDMTAYRLLDKAAERGFLPERQKVPRSPRLPTNKPRQPKQSPKRKGSR